MYNNRTRGPISDKPFGFVTIDSGADKFDPKTHEKYVEGAKTGFIAGTIIARSPVTVATGILELSESVSSKGQGNFPLVREMTRKNGVLCLPGSSIKGCIRSLVEAVTKSCIAKGRDNPDNLRECVVKGQRTQCCRACSMFGAMGYLARVSFEDALLKEGGSGIMQIPALFKPQSKRGAQNGTKRKFYYNHKKTASGSIPTEVCNAGAKFGFRCTFSNLEDRELGVLLACLGLGDPPFKIKLGGARPVGYGSVTFDLEELRFTPRIKDRYLSWDGEGETVHKGEALKNEVSKLISAGKQIIVQKQFVSLTDILTEEVDPPVGLY